MGIGNKRRETNRARPSVHCPSVCLVVKLHEIDCILVKYCYKNIQKSIGPHVHLTVISLLRSQLEDASTRHSTARPRCRKRHPFKINRLVSLWFQMKFISSALSAPVILDYTMDHRTAGFERGCLASRSLVARTGRDISRELTHEG